MYRDRSWSRQMSASRCRTCSASIVSSLPGRSGASNEISSKSFSITVYRRRAPMFSVLSFTRMAISAMASTASGRKWSVTPSVFNSSTYCRTSAFRGSVRMRTKSSRVKGSSSTRIGNRPWSSGIRSDGLATWKAPAAMKRTWSVRTTPYLVVTAEPSGGQLRAELLESRLAGGSRSDLLERGAAEGLGAGAWQQEIEQSVLGEPLRLLLHLRRQLGLHHVDAQLGEVADHRFDIATHIADFGVLGGFDLDERRLSKLGEPSRDLGFADAGGTDHDDVLRRDLVAELGRQVLAPPPVAQGDGHRALGLALADDVAIELQDDLRGGQPAAHSVSTVIWSFV